MKLVILAAAVLCLAGAARAEPIDLSKLACKDFIVMSKETIASITTWLDGYYTDEEDPAVVDLDKMKVRTEKLVSYCTQNPRLQVMTAAEDVLDK